MNELFNTLFNNAFDNELANCGFGTSMSFPKVDVSQTKKSYIIEMDLPGRTENDVNLELDNNVLTISSAKEEVNVKDSADSQDEKSNEEKAEDEKTRWILKERRSTNFSRRFTLPDDVDSENVSAAFKNGVLTVTVPRKELAAPKKIAITA